VDKIIIATLLFLASTVGCTNSAFALFDGTDSGNVGTDWTNTDKNLHTTGSGTFDNDLTVGDDTSITGDLTASGTITLNTTKFNSKTFRSDYDYTSLAVAFSSIGAVTPTRLSICQDNIVADGTTITQTPNIVLDFTCGGTIDGIAGGGTETLTLNGSMIGGISRIFKSNLTVTGTPKVPAIYPQWFGAIVDDAVDDASAIQSAINLAGDAGGAIVNFPEGEYLISTDITVTDNNVFLQGYGYQSHMNVNTTNPITQWTQNDGTVIRWIGTSGTGTMLTFAPPVTGPTLHGVGYDGLILNCAGLANYGLEILSVRGGHFGQVLVADAIIRNMHIGCQPTATWTSTDPNSTQHCNFNKIISRTWLATALSADGILIDGDDTADVSFCTFGEIFYIHADGGGLAIKSSDACNFGTILGYRIPTYTGFGARVYGGVSVADHARKHHFGFMEVGAGGFRAIANTIFPVDHIIDMYSLGNGTAQPTIDKGAVVSYTLDVGLRTISRTSTTPEIKTLRADGDAGGEVISSYKANAYDSAGTETTYASASSTITDPTDGSEDGSYIIATMVGGTLSNAITITDGIKFFTGAVIKRLLSNTSALDFPNIAANGGVQDLTIAVTGALAGDSVVLGLPANGGSNSVIYQARVSAVDVVSVKATNTSAAPIDPANQSFRVTVIGF
jgi:hypothetical protein